MSNENKTFHAPIPQVGTFCHFWDDGKSSPSRHYIAKVERLIPIEEAKDIIIENNCYEDYPLSLYDIWREEVDGCTYNPGLYQDETDYIVEASCPKYDENNLYFVRSKYGWFSMDVQSFWQSGQLDVDGGRFESILNERKLRGDNIDGYTEETYE